MPHRSQTAEQLRETVARLERDRRNELQEREFLDRILRAVRTGVDPADTSASDILQALRDSLELSDVFVMAGTDGRLETAYTTHPRFRTLRWEAGPAVSRILAGQIVAVVDAAAHPLWSALPPDVREGVGSAIHVPLSVGDEALVLVCTHAGPAHFGRTQAGLMERFAPLFSQLIQAMRATEAEAEASQLRQEQEIVEALAQSSSRLTTLLQSMHSGVLLEDEDRHVVLANEAFCSMFQVPVPPEELEGADCRAMAQAGSEAFVDPTRFLSRIEEILAGAQPVEDEEIRTKDGRTLLRDFVPIAVEGQGRGHLWQYRDVTQQRANQALNRAIVETALDAIITMDHRGLIVEFNPAAEQIFGHERSRVIGELMADIVIPEAMRAAHTAGMARYLEGGEARILGQRLELEAIRSDGTAFPVELTVNRIPGSQPPVFTGVVRDITESKRRARELEQATQAAEQASRAKSDFLAMMSHEIRTPMNAILGMTELSIDMAEGGEQLGLLRSVQSAAESLLHVINDVLDLSKVEAGRLVLREEAFCVADVMESVTEALAPRAFEKGLELSCSVDPGLTVPVEGDPNRLRQILVNLLGNAVKFTEEGQVALTGGTVEADAEALSVHFSVSDTGIGMSDDDLSKIFEPFFQADSSLSRDFGGTGLGLGISQSLVELMDGRLWAESTPGEGSVFHFEIPLRRSRQAFARRRASDARFERWQAWILTPSETLADGVVHAYDSVHIPTSHVDLEGLKRGTAGDGDLRHVIVADQRLGLDTLEAIAVVAREAGSRTDVRLCVLVPPGPIDPWRVDGPTNTVYATKPASRRKLCSVVAHQPEADLDVVHGSPEDRVRHAGRVLLVEDNPANQNYASRVLEGAGYGVTIAEDGEEGLRELEGGSYDLVLTDLDMPNMDGIEMTREILSRLGDDAPPILAFTAHVVQGFLERCEEVGMVGFVSKPARPADLLRAVGEHVLRHRTVLVVDDSADNRELTRRFLAKEPIALELVPDGRAAIERVRRGGVAAMLLDMSMPGIDGYETARRLRALPEGASLPILAMTSWVGSEEEARCLDAGCTAYLEKPLRRDALIDAVARLLDPTEGPSGDAVEASTSVTVDPIIADLVPEYLEARVQDVNDLKASLDRGDLESIRVLAHNLAGSGEAYGFSRLTELGRALEDVTVAGDRDEVAEWIDEIERYVSSVEWEVGAAE